MYNLKKENMSSRRSFVKNMVVGGLALPTSMSISPFHKPHSAYIHKKLAPETRIGLIGKGNMGTANMNTALKIPGVKVVAVCDLFDYRIDQVEKEWGQGIYTTKDYKALLEQQNVDAVIIGTPDHWHHQITLDALAAGKHVYCEKPIIHQLSETASYLKAGQIYKPFFQMGSQGMASMGNRAAKMIVESGMIGKINFIEGKYSRSPEALYSFQVPTEANKETIWWDRFLGDAPKRSFDAQRFLQWRNWRDYSTGLAGDLFVHVISSVHFITSALGPEKVYTTGGIHHYTDGSRDTPDLMLALMDYPDRHDLGRFKLSLGANYVDGVSKNWASMDFDIIGGKGKINVGWNQVTLQSLEPISTLDQEEIAEIGQFMGGYRKLSEHSLVFEVQSDYQGGHYDHWTRFIDGIHGREPIIADIPFGLRASAAALLSYKSYVSEKSMLWDAEKLRVK